MSQEKREKFAEALDEQRFTQLEKFEQLLTNEFDIARQDPELLTRLAFAGRDLKIVPEIRGHEISVEFFKSSRAFNDFKRDLEGSDIKIRSVRQREHRGIATEEFILTLGYPASAYE